MRTTVNLNDTIMADLHESTGIRGTSALINQALVEMQQRQAARRLAALGGTMPFLKDVPRRRPPEFVNPE